MRFSEAWLREWVNPKISTQELASQLSMAGLEVDAVEPAAARFNGVVVGAVLSREHHPDADKLSVCSVDVGGEGPLRFWRQMEDRGYYPRLELSGDEATVTNFRCQSGFVESPGLPLKVTYCVRAYRKLEGLYDAYLSATSLVADTQALQTRLALSGFSWESLERFTNAYLEGLQWQP